MKKIRSFLMGSIAALLTSLMLQTNVSAAAPEIIGKSAIVTDVESGEVLYKKNAETVRQPASITKIMTALVVLENSHLNDEVEFSAEALYSIESGSSAAYIKPGEVMTVEQSLYVMMLHSANDVAHGLAYYIGGDLPGFAEMMNEKAKSLGCENTHFVNASGLSDDDHYTTAQDMAKIAKEAYENPQLRRIMSTEYYKLAPTNKCAESRTWRNGNRMIQSGSEYYYEPCLGGKTGYTIAAGGTLVTYSSQKGKVLSCVILKSQNSATAYADSIALYDYVEEAGLIPQKKVEKPVLQETVNSQQEGERTFMGTLFTILKFVGIAFLVIAAAVTARILYAQQVNKKRREERLRKQKKLKEQQKKEAEKRQHRYIQK